jgi:hypothetical protein
MTATLVIKFEDGTETVITLDKFIEIKLPPENPQSMCVLQDKRGRFILNATSSLLQGKRFQEISITKGARMVMREHHTRARHASETITEYVSGGLTTRFEAAGFDLPGFYFWDETEAFANGPYKDLNEAIKERDLYFLALSVPNGFAYVDSAPGQITIRLKKDVDPNDLEGMHEARTCCYAFAQKSRRNVVWKHPHGKDETFNYFPA